jgi:hypothetical protein
VSRRRPIADIGNPASANVVGRRHHADDPALSSVLHRGADHSGADGHLHLAELAAAVSNAGGLGGIGTLFRSFAAIKRDIDMVRS